MEFYSSQPADVESVDMAAFEGKMSDTAVAPALPVSSELPAPSSSIAGVAGGLAGPLVGLPPSAATSVVEGLFKGARAQVSIIDPYSTIDRLRPYFDVETEEVIQRLLWSLHPRKGSMLLKQFDLYAPLMLVFTLAALLVMGMKAAHVSTRLGAESTLIGTALMVAFSMWALTTFGLYVGAHATPGVAPARLVSLGCATGYALAGVCAPLALRLILASAFACLIGTLTIGLASAATLALTVSSQAEGEAILPTTDALASLASGTGGNGRKGLLVVGLLGGATNLLGTLYLSWQYFGEVVEAPAAA